MTRLWTFSGPIDQLKALADWQMQYHEHERSKPTMQRQFTIEVRVDYEDSAKNEAMRLAVAQAAQHVYAKACLLKDGQKPTIAAFSDDWYSGREEIEVIPNTIQQGLDSITGDGDEPSVVSDELLAAFK